MTDYRQQLRQYIDDTFVLASDGPTYADDDSFMENHIVDSTGFLELIMFVEETWGVSVADDEVVPANFDSLNGLQDYLTRKLSR
jgi:acyl carrier protein